jgi:sulfonate transport system substrate-binding protein
MRMHVQGRFAMALDRRGVVLALAGCAAVATAGCGGATPVAPAGGAAAAAAVSLPSHIPAGTELRVGDQGDALKLPMQLSGQDAALPYHVTYATFNGGPPLLEAFKAGAIDFGLVGDTVALKAQASGQDAVVVAAYRGNGYGQALVVPPGRAAGIRTLADLRGRKVAYTFGTALQGFAVEALATAGLAERDVQRVELSIPDITGAVKSGDVDAGVLVEPALSRYLAATPGARVLRDSKGLVTGLIYLISSRAALADPAKVAAIADFISHEVAARAWVNAHPAQWIDGYYVRDQRVPADIAATIAQKTGASAYVPIDASVIAAQQKLADLFASSGVIPQRVNAAAVFDKRFNNVVQTAISKQPGGGTP